MSSWTYDNPFTYTAVEPDVVKCGYCDEEIQPGERCIDYFRGVIGRSEKTGRLMVVADKYDPEEPAIFHEECHALWKNESLQDEEEELMKFCAGCGSKLNGD